MSGGIEKPAQIVVSAAIRFKGSHLMLCGARHWDAVMRAQFTCVCSLAPQGFATSLKAAGEEQGFIDQFGEFLTRQEAMQIVIDNLQMTRTPREDLNPDGELYSEDLY